MGICDEILRIFRFSRGFGSWKIDGLPDRYPAWVIRIDSGIGVAFQIPKQMEIDESFSDISIQCRYLSIADMPPHFYLTLLCDRDSNDYYEKYSLICENFVRSTDGTEREAIIRDPFAWWFEWSDLIGNVNMVKEPYSVIAEMLSLEHLLIMGETVSWEGPWGGTVDLRGSTFDCEVKSSSRRYSDEIELASELQLKKGDLPLHLYYCVFEKSDSGISVDSIAKHLVRLGFNENVMEEGLARVGLSRGKASRFEKFHLLKFWDFLVDDDFPRIVPESFIGGSLPVGIKRIKYTVDLHSVPHKELDVDITR